MEDFKQDVRWIMGKVEFEFIESMQNNGVSFKEAKNEVVRYIKEYFKQVEADFKADAEELEELEKEC